MKKILFVCLGNICRSPAAEGVFKHLLKTKGLEHQYLVDSCGTSGYHAGDRADKRMRRAAEDRGMNLTSVARAFEVLDFKRFDYIVAMDNKNYENLFALTSSREEQQRMVRFCDYVHLLPFEEVPDPYYGGENGFITVLDILEEGAQNLLIEIQNND